MSLSLPLSLSLLPPSPLSPSVLNMAEPNHDNVALTLGLLDQCRVRLGLLADTYVPCLIRRPSHVTKDALGLFCFN